MNSGKVFATASGGNVLVPIAGLSGTNGTPATPAVQVSRIALDPKEMESAGFAYYPTGRRPVLPGLMWSPARRGLLRTNAVSTGPFRTLSPGDPAGGVVSEGKGNGKGAGNGKRHGSPGTATARVPDRALERVDGAGGL